MLPALQEGRGMRSIIRVGSVALLVALVAGCAPSGYILEARNNMAQPVDLKIQAKKDNDAARTVGNPQVAPGANIHYHTKAERDEKVSLEARLVGDAQSPPAVFRMIVGTSRVTINPNPDANKDARQPKVKIREER
jgi:hypothetical protein